MSRVVILIAEAVYVVVGVWLGVRWGRRAYKGFRFRRCRRAGHTIMQLDVADWQPNGGVVNVQAHRQCVTCDGTRLAVSAHHGPWGVRVQLEGPEGVGQWGWRLAGGHRAAAVEALRRGLSHGNDAAEYGDARTLIFPTGTTTTVLPSGPQRYVEEARRADDDAAARAYAELGADRYALGTGPQGVDFEHDEATRAMEEIDRIIAEATEERVAALGYEHDVEAEQRTRWRTYRKTEDS